MPLELDIWDYLQNRNQEDIVVDLRDSTQYAFGTIEGAVHIPMEKLSQLYQLPKDKPIYLLCQSGDFSGEMAELMQEEGYAACNLAGGYRAYLRKQMELESKLKQEE